jgi:hypothetical protein
MAQTTNQIPMACGSIEFSDGDCTSWTDISGESQSVSGTEQSRMSGEAYTLDGDTALVCGGKREPMELVFVIVYTEDNAEVYEEIRSRWEATGCGTRICIRWSPLAGAAGAALLTASGILTSFTYPPIDAASGGCIMAGFTLKAPYITTTFVAT